MFFGRDDLLSQLSALLRKRVASLVTCRGRRRVGKSTLIEVFATRSKCRFLKIEGRRPASGLTNADELSAFAKQLADQTTAESTPPTNWTDAFRRLNAQINDRERTVVLLDEVSWLAHYDDSFADDLKIAWDNLLKKHDKLILVLCGSVSSWIRDNIIDNGAYMGRRSLDVVVKELPLKDCVKFWGKAANRIDHREIIDVLSVTGGIPRYLEEIRPALTIDENIRRMCFLKQGLLFREFDETFSAVFGTSAGRRRAVIETLAHGTMTASDIAEKLGGDVNGHLTRTLQELEYAGFVARESNLNAATGKPARIDRYRICDNYVRFYLHFIEPNKAAISNGLFRFASMEQLKGWNSQLGYQFENLIVNHVGDLFGHLGIERSLVLSAAPYVQRGTKRGEGCQIDLLVQTLRTVFVVEIKRRREIGAEVMDEVAEKVRRLKVARGTSIRTALVYDGRLSPRIEAEHGFDVVIPADRLL